MIEMVARAPALNTPHIDNGASDGDIMACSTFLPQSRLIIMSGIYCLTVL